MRKTKKIDLSTKLHEAVASALAAADKGGIPQFVFLDESGWNHLAEGCKAIAGKPVDRVVLPANYFA